jgi:hypothetical protein
MEISAHSNGIVSLTIFLFNLNDACTKQNKETLVIIKRRGDLLFHDF